MQRTRLVAMCASILVATALSGGAVRGADKGRSPTISGYLTKPVMLAQEEMKKHNYAGAIAELKKAVDVRNSDKTSFSVTSGNEGRESAYDKYIITQMMAISYYSMQDLAAAAPLLHEAAVSQYSDPAQTKQFLTVDMEIYYQTLKNYPECIAAGQELIQRNLADADIYTTIALSQMAQDKNKEAAQTIQEFIDKQPKPDEKLLTFQWNAYNKANDGADASKVVEQLVKFYPKPEYWKNALAPLLNAHIQDPHLQLDVFRLMEAVGALTDPGDYSDMAGVALDQGFPGEAANVLQKAFANHVFTDPRDVAHYQQVLTGAQQRAASDQKTLPQQMQQAQSAASGDALVGVGTAYLSYEQPDKAVELINQGISRGNLKYPEQANLLLGVAELRAHKASEAQRAFDKVETSSNAGYAHLGKLWALHAEGASNAQSGPS
jgi:tetratricopeptide (TPR) repeat protein